LKEKRHAHCALFTPYLNYAESLVGKGFSPKRAMGRGGQDGIRVGLHILDKIAIILKKISLITRYTAIFSSGLPFGLRNN
jgi:hypothetical protein